jgi:hypothetical protein
MLNRTEIGSKDSIEATLLKRVRSLICIFPVKYPKDVQSKSVKYSSNPKRRASNAPHNHLITPKPPVIADVEKMCAVFLKLSFT